MKGARFGSSLATSSGQQRALAALLLALPLLGSASGASATCLSGAGFTGFEVGGHTLFVGSASDSLTSSCLPISLLLEPGILAGETGRAEMTASQMGYSQGAAASIGGQVSGGNAASVLGSVSYVFRVESLPGYSGPGTTDISLDVLLDVSGGVQASGIGSSAAASYTAAGSLRRVSDLLAVSLFEFSGGSAGAVPHLMELIQNVSIDTNYVLSFSGSQSVSAATTGAAGSASAAAFGITRISFGIDLADGLLGSALGFTAAEPGLIVVFPMVEALGVLPPRVGFPPLLPSEEVPAPPAIVLLAVALATLRRKLGA